MKTIEQTRRELFEAEYCKRNECGIDHMQKDGKFYQRDSAQIAWGWFNAALDAVEIQLPSEVAQFADDDRGRRAFSLFTNTAIRGCRSAIESTNLGLKII